MVAMLRGDLYRALRVPGTVFWYLLVLVVVVFANVAFAGLFGQVLNDMFANAAAETASQADAESSAALTAIDMFANFSSPTHFLGACLMSYGLITMLVCWCVTGVAWADLRDGYAKGLVTGCGKRDYYLGKLLYAGVLSAVFVAVGALVGLALVPAFGISYAVPDSAAHIVLWCVFAMLITWGCAALSLAVLWLAKNQVVAYLVAFFLASGFLSTLLSGVLLALPGMDALASAVDAVISWLPRSAVGMLNTGASGAVDVLGGAPKEAVSIALTPQVVAHVVVDAVVLLAASVALVLGVVRKRDL